MQDKEEWIDERAHDLALKHFGEDFDALPHDRQMYCWSLAEDDYNNLMVDKAEAMANAYYEIAMEAKMEREMEENSKPFTDCPDNCENSGHCENTEGCLERLEHE